MTARRERALQGGWQGTGNREQGNTKTRGAWGSSPINSSSTAGFRTRLIRFDRRLKAFPGRARDVDVQRLPASSFRQRHVSASARELGSACHEQGCHGHRTGGSNQRLTVGDVLKQGVFVCFGRAPFFRDQWRWALRISGRPDIGQMRQRDSEPAFSLHRPRCHAAATVVPSSAWPVGNGCESFATNRPGSTSGALGAEQPARRERSPASSVVSSDRSDGGIMLPFLFLFLLLFLHGLLSFSSTEWSAVESLPGGLHQQQCFSLVRWVRKGKRGRKKKVGQGAGPGFRRSQLPCRGEPSANFNPLVPSRQRRKC